MARRQITSPAAAESYMVDLRRQTVPEHLSMSYLNPPRLHFAGKFDANVSTVNNDPFHFNTGTFQPSYQDLQSATAMNGWFNPRGDAAFRLIGCQITGAYGAGGRPAGADPVFGCMVSDSDRLAPAKLVDLDPEQQMVSTIFGLEVRIADPIGSSLMRGSFEPAPFTDLWGRAAGPGSDTNAGSMYQSVLTNLEWGDVSHSPFLMALRAAATDGLLSIKFNVDGFNMDFGGPDFMRGRIVGTIGPAATTEPRHFVAGRQLVPDLDENENPKGGIYYCTAVVDEPAGAVRLDLGNALPTVDAGGDVVPRAMLGRLALACLDPAQSAPVLLGQIPYWRAGWYQSSAGVVDVPVTPQQLASISEHPLALLTGTGSPVTWTPAVQEAGSGLHVRADMFAYRLDPGETVHVPVYVTRFGGRVADAEVTALRDDSGMQSGPVPGHPPSSLPPGVGEPADGISIATVKPTDSGGATELEITAGDPENPRVFIDGQLYGVRPSLPAAPATDPPPNPSDFVSLLVFDGFDPDEPLAWHGTEQGSMQPIFQQFANLYPVMYTFLDLGDYEDVCRNRDMLLLAFRLAEEDPNSMPVTRDLSGAKRAAAIRWLDAVGRDGKPRLGTAPPPSEREAPELAAVAATEGPPEGAELARKGGKTAALARRIRPLGEPPPRASA
jgi:hypothetical protein